MLGKKTLQALPNFSKTILKFIQSIKFTFVTQRKCEVTNTFLPVKTRKANNTIIISYNPTDNISFIPKPPKLFNCFNIFVIHGIWGSSAYFNNFLLRNKMPTIIDCFNEVLCNSHKLHLPWYRSHMVHKYNRSYTNKTMRNEYSGSQNVLSFNMSNVMVRKGNQFLSPLTAHYVTRLPAVSVRLSFSNNCRTNFSHYEVANKPLLRRPDLAYDALCIQFPSIPLHGVPQNH